MRIVLALSAALLCACPVVLSAGDSPLRDKIPPGAYCRSTHPFNYCIFPGTTGHGYSGTVRIWLTRDNRNGFLMTILLYRGGRIVWMKDHHPKKNGLLTSFCFYRDDRLVDLSSFGRCESIWRYEFPHEKGLGKKVIPSSRPGAGRVRR